MTPRQRLVMPGWSMTTKGRETFQERLDVYDVVLLA